MCPPPFLQAHDISFEWFTTHTVFRKGSGTDLNIDFHREATYANLVSDVNLGEATRPYDSGGAKGRGPYAGSWQTLWNLRSSTGTRIPLPEHDFGSNLNFVGTNHIGAVAEDWYAERIDNDQLSPADLYNAQVNRRLKRTVYP
jgi:hypothetical protein